MCFKDQGSYKDNTDTELCRIAWFCGNSSLKLNVYFVLDCGVVLLTVIYDCCALAGMNVNKVGELGPLMGT